jgi:hypothetical protein
MMGLLFLGACGQSTTGPVTTAGKSIYTSDVQTVVAEDEGGGFVPQPPPGSACSLGAAKYTLTVATKQVDWTRCVSSGTDPYKQTMGSKTLSEADFKELTTYLEKLTVAPNDNTCGADKPTETLTIVTPSGQQVYGDSFYACNTKDKPLVQSDGLDNLLAEFNKLTM